MKTFEESINLEELELTEVEPEPTFEEIMANITEIQDSWLNYYDEEGNLYNKDGEIIEPAPIQLEK